MPLGAVAGGIGVVLERSRVFRYIRLWAGSSHSRAVPQRQNCRLPADRATQGMGRREPWCPVAPSSIVRTHVGVK